MSLPHFLDELARADGVSAVNEATRIALAHSDALRVHEYDEVVVALAAGDAPVEFAVHPRYRRQGRGQALLTLLTARGETQFWAHGNLPGARALAHSAGLNATRTLLVLRQSARSGPLEVPPGVVVRTFVEADIEAVLAINAAAFAAHPEQGAMDRADFDRRRTQDWFDPAGLFVAEIDGQVVGFHWTKRERSEGEVYVVGVDPAAHGRGLGTILTDVGVQHLWDSGVAQVDLYVEGDNAAALALYAKLGFTEHARDTLYTVR